MIPLNLLHIALIYLAIINVVTFFMYSIDKWCSTSGRLIPNGRKKEYKDTIGEPFTWLYIDADILKQVADENGYNVEIVSEGEHYDYLKRITKIE